MNRFVFIVSLGALAGSASAQTFLMVVDSAQDKVQKLDPVTGQYLGEFCTMPVTGSGATPKEAIQVGSEVWVSDQLQDNIVRFDASGAFIDEVLGRTQGLDNVRGFEVADGKIWVTCGSGQFAGQVAVFAQDDREFLFAVNVGGSPFDAKLFNGEILVTNSTSHDIDRVGFDGTILGTFVDSTGPDAPLDFPQQLDVGTTEIVVAEFSSAEEIFRFDFSGNLLQEIDTAPQGGMRGIYALSAGGYIIANGNGAHLYSESTLTTLLPGSCQYINLYSVVTGCAADFNGDGFLDFFDYDDFVSCFESGTCPAGRDADFNNDDFVDFFDYDDYVNAFEAGC